MKSSFELNNCAAKLRKDWGEDVSSPIDIEALVLQQNNITLVKMRMPRDMSGMCVKSGGEMILAINTEMSLGRQRFTLAHELYHAYYDESMTTFVCMKSIDEGRLDSEREADLFASFLLLPPIALDEFRRESQEKNWNINDIVRAEQMYGISHQAMMVRLSKENRITKKQYEKLRLVPVIRIASELGFPKDLYCNTVDSKAYSCVGSYLRAIEEAYKREIIGEGKRKELLVDGFADYEIESGEFIND